MLGVITLARLKLAKTIIPLSKTTAKELPKNVITAIHHSVHVHPSLILIGKTAILYLVMETCFAWIQILLIIFLEIVIQKNQDVQLLPLD